MKYFILTWILLLFQSCSFNNDSKYWNEHNEQRIIKQKKLSEIIKKSNNIISMSMEEYNIYIDDYTKKSKYPNISK
tara:strand:- start:2 stop:229 length:228 start_codon:yes stop_codon:yes gene_type:complete